MKSETPLDYAVFQLSPKRSRCELVVSHDGNTEKLASGLVKPFVSHLKVAEEQVAQAVESIRLEVEKRKNAESWFTKGTLERFVRFVSTPEVLELVNTFDAEMSQLEAARRIYSQGAGDQHFGALGGDGTGSMAAADATKKELLRAIDVRLVAVRQDLTTACARASSAGFNLDTVSELQQFADQFGAHRLNEACTKFISLCQRRRDVMSSWRPDVDDQAIRCSWGSDMSIDDPTEDQTWSHNIVRPHQSFISKNHSANQEQPKTTQKEQLVDHLKLNTFQQDKSTSSLSTTQQLSQDEKNEKEKKDEGLTESSTNQVSQPTRRLSVQDRINLFENKQKESSSSGGKPISVGKSAELRRLSSDVSSASVVTEKAVLRRWSGASDMSIDLGNDKKDSNIDSPLCTPSSSSVLQVRNNTISGLPEDNYQKNQKKLSDISDSGLKDKDEKSDAEGVGDFGLKDQTEVKTWGGNSSGKEEEVGLKGRVNWKDQVGSFTTQYRSSTGKSENGGLGDHGVPHEKKVSIGGGEKNAAFKDQASSELQSKGMLNEPAFVDVKSQPTSETQIGGFVGKLGAVKLDDEFSTGVEDVELKDQPAMQSRIRCPRSSQSLSGQLEVSVGIKIKEIQYEGSQEEQAAPQAQWRSFVVGAEEVGNKEATLSEKQSVKLEGSGVQRMKFQKPDSAGSEQIKKFQGRRDEIGSVRVNDKPTFPVNIVSENEGSCGTTPTMLIEQVQRVRQSKGNQELNDELKMKANELEKLFAEHKLRVPGDQSNSARRSKLSDMQTEQTSSSQHRKPAAAEISPAQYPDTNALIQSTGSSSNVSKFSTPPTTKMIGNQDYTNTLRHNFSELSFSDDSRGKLYEKYMQKRDAKLREEWGSKRVEKEAKLKAMQDILEQSRDEMKAKFSGSSDRQDSGYSARRRAEKLRSFSSRSNMKREQHPISTFQSEEDEDSCDFPDQKYHGQDRSFNESSLGDGSSRSSQSKKLLPNRNTSSSTPRNIAAQVPRLSAKVSSTSSGRRRGQSDNPLAQSVPNFSDLRKENTKPSGVSKTTNRIQVRNYARSKSSSEEVPPAKEEKPRRSQSLRKSSAGPVEFTEFSTLSSDDVGLASSKFEKEQCEQTIQDKFLRNVETKPFLKKGNGIGPGTGSSIAKLKASMSSETLKNEECDELAFEAAHSVDMAGEDEEEELETMAAEDGPNMDNGRARLSQEFDKCNSGSENGDALRSLSEIDPASVAELPAAVPSTFQTVALLQDSPGESPLSWNSRMHHLFTYQHETSDIDASVDSPIGSPASWNSHSLTQTEADAARMRKKWGSAQKPILVANSSHNQSRKDVTKGFKRLLKFGRKNRGTESLVDWISATTSEGDDDTEDARDPANRSSEDLRKSRMGFFHGHPPEDVFNESDLFNEQVQALNSSIPVPPANFKLREDHMSGSSMKAPRSFFSLSTFRSKGSDSKPR